MKTALKTTLLLFLIIALSSTYAQAIKYNNGARIMPIESETPEEEELRGDYYFQVLLSKAMLHKHNTLFKDERAVYLKVDATILSANTITSQPRETTFARIYKFDITQFTSGRISIPFNDLLVFPWYRTYLPDNCIVTGVRCKISFVKVTSDSTFKHVMEKALDFTKELPIPENPYTLIAKSVGDFTTSLLDDEFFKENSDVTEFSSVLLNFNHSSKAANNFFSSSIKSGMSLVKPEGSFALVMGTVNGEETKPGSIDVLNPDGTVKYDSAKGVLLLVKGDTEVPVANDYVVLSVSASKAPYGSMRKYSDVKMSSKYLTKINQNKNLQQWHINPDIFNKSPESIIKSNKRNNSYYNLSNIYYERNLAIILKRYEELGVDLSKIPYPFPQYIKK